MAKKKSNKLLFIILVVILVLVLLMVGVFTNQFSKAPEDVVVAATNDPALNTDDQVVNNDLSVDFEEISINEASSVFLFEGYGPGKSHSGTFESYSGEVLLNEGEIVGFRGIIQSGSVKTKSEGLTNHLLNEDFFNSEVYPMIKFGTTIIDNGVATGNLEFLGVEKEISFPVTINDEIISTDFLLDTSEFGLSYPGVNEKVRIAFNITN